MPTYKPPPANNRPAPMAGAPAKGNTVDVSASVERDLSGYLNRMLREKGLQRIDVVHEAHLSEPFGYQVFTGARNPGRDNALALCFALGCTVDEAQQLLWHAGAAHLYAKNRRDATVMLALSRGCSLLEADQLLYRSGEQTI